MESSFADNEAVHRGDLLGKVSPYNTVALCTELMRAVDIDAEFDAQFPVDDGGRLWILLMAAARHHGDGASILRSEVEGTVGQGAASVDGSHGCIPCEVRLCLVDLGLVNRDFVFYPGSDSDCCVQD